MNFEEILNDPGCFIGALVSNFMKRLLALNKAKCTFNGVSYAEEEIITGVSDPKV